MQWCFSQFAEAASLEKMILPSTLRGSPQLARSFLFPDGGSFPMVIDIVCQSLVCVAFKGELTNASVVIGWHNPLWLSMSSTLLLCQGSLQVRKPAGRALMFKSCDFVMVSFEGKSCVSHGKKRQWTTKENNKKLGYVLCWKAEVSSCHSLFRLV